MFCFSIPTGTRQLVDRFKSLLPAKGALASYANRCALLCFFLLENTSLCALARSCPWSRSVSDLSRAVQLFPGNRFMKRLRASVLRRYRDELNPEDFVFAVDDTSNPKYGGNIFRCGRWHDGKGFFIGQKILVVVLVDIKRGFALPLAYRFGVKKTDPAYKSMPDLAVDALREISAAGFPQLDVTSDSWFDSTDFMRNVAQLGLTYAGEIKANRLVRGSAAPKVPWLHLPQFFSGRPRQKIRAKLPHPSQKVRRGAKTKRFIIEAVVMIRGYIHPVKLMAVYNTAREKKAFAYYVSTNRLMSGARLWKVARARWNIEVMFRDLKQNLSFGRLPCAGEAASDLAVCMPFAILVSLRLEPALWGLPNDDKRTIGAKIADIQEHCLAQSLAKIIAKPQSPLIKRLQARRSNDWTKRKPRDKRAAELRDHGTLAAQGF